MLPILRRLTAASHHPLHLSLALQGGGAHGAFTWGVLDRLLDEPSFVPMAVSGTSAGACNAVALAWGWTEGGAEGARAKLAALWNAIADAAAHTPLRFGIAGTVAFDLATFMLAPQQLNPLGIDPLREILEDLVDFAALRARSAMPVIIAATRVRTGQARLFREHELTVEMMLASACLPQIHRAVEIGGELYWDGGFSANPPVLALVELARTPRLLVVRLNPAEVSEPPHRATAIRHRAAQIVFGRPLMDELARLEDLRRHADRPFDWLWPRLHHLSSLDLQILDGDETLASLDPGTKLAPDRRLLERLKHAGRQAADAWLGGRHDAGKAA